MPANQPFGIGLLVGILPRFFLRAVIRYSSRRHFVRLQQKKGYINFAALRPFFCFRLLTFLWLLIRSYLVRSASLHVLRCLVFGSPAGRYRLRAVTVFGQKPAPALALSRFFFSLRFIQSLATVVARAFRLSPACFSLLPFAPLAVGSRARNSSFLLGTILPTL